MPNNPGFEKKFMLSPSGFFEVLITYSNNLSLKYLNISAPKLLLYWE